MTTMQTKISQIEIGAPIAVPLGGGFNTFGNTVISWVPSISEKLIEITVTMGGAVIQKQKLTPNSNTMAYNGVSGPNKSQGRLSAEFDASGRSGHIYGELTWTSQQSESQYSGMIGTWSSES